MPRASGSIIAVASSVWSVALAILAVRIYVAKLGIEAYGVIGFFLSLQIVFQILDLGLAPAVNREVARASATGRSPLALVATLARVYWGMAAAIALLLVAVAPLLATHWLEAAHLAPDVLIRSLMLMGLIIAARWPVALYQNTLIGLGQLGLASGMAAAANTTAIAASVMVLTLISPTLPAFFATQAAVSLVYAGVIRGLAWHALKRNRLGDHPVKPEWRLLRDLWRFSAGMSGVALTGIALTQIDKAILSKLLPLAQFGEYMLAVTAANGLTALISPVFNVIFPRLSALVAEGRSDAVRRFYLEGTRIFAGLYLPVVIALGLYAHDVVWIWTGRAATADTVAPLLTMLCAGWAINGVMYFPYSLQLAHGLSRLPFVINTLLLVLLGPLVLALATRLGPLGGAMTWPILQLVYFVTGTIATYRRVPDIGRARDWLIRGIAPPVLISIGIMAALHPLLAMAAPGSAVKLAAIAASVITTQLTCLVVHSEVRVLIAARGHAVLSRLRT